MKINHIKANTASKSLYKHVQDNTPNISFKAENEDFFCKAKQPWGCMPFLEEKKDYKVRKIYVKPNQRLSLQNHQHRNENWIVARGNPTFHVGDSIEKLQTRELKVTDSVFIPIGKLHRLENNTNSDVIIIEVQTGDYIGDDDIKRYKDSYNRQDVS